MARVWGLIVVGLLTACSSPPEDVAVTGPDPIEIAPLDVESGDPSSAGLDDAQETEPYDPGKDLTLLTCGAHKTIDLIGTPLADAQAAARLPETARIIAPGDLVSQDYDTKRMNVFVDASGIITKIDCG